MKQRILITGGAGFIGSHTADAFKKAGFQVRILDALLPPVHKKNWPKYIKNKGFELIRGDVREKKVWERALRNVSFVYHLAAYQDQRLDFSTFFTTNTVSTALLYEVIVEKNFPIKKIILASSQFVYGDGKYHCMHSGKKITFYPELRSFAQLKKGDWNIKCPHGKAAKAIPFKEDQGVTPTNSYGLSKKALEDLAFRLGKTYGIPTVAMRYSIVQGSRQSPRNLYSGALRIFVSQALAGLPITVYEDGSETRDFINIHDVVRANLLVLRSSRANFQILNVGGGTAYKVMDFAKEVKKMTGSNSPIVVGGFRRTDTRHAVSDISKLKELGWTPKYTTRDSLLEYIDWFRSEGFDRSLDVAHLESLKKGIVK